MSKKIIALLAAILFSINCILADAASALAPWAGTELAATRAAMFRQYLERELGAKIIYETTAEDHDLLQNSFSNALLLFPRANYLISKEAKADDLKFLRAILHEDIEAVMQILYRFDSSRYRSIRGLITEYLPPNEENVSQYFPQCGSLGLSAQEFAIESSNDEHLVNLYVNHIAAKAFETLLLINYNVITKNQLKASDHKFLEKITSLINTNKHNYFTGVFWDLSSRNAYIRTAVAGGMEFKRAADGMKRSSRDMSTAGIVSNRNFLLLKTIPTIAALAERDLHGKFILVRVNVNVRSKEGIIQDATRLEMIRPVVEFILSKGATPILIGHNGRLDKKKNKDDRQSLKDAAKYIQALFPAAQVAFHQNSIAKDTGEGLKISKADIVPAAINILENVRFADEYELGAKRKVFARSLIDLSDGIFIFDAFGDIGSEGASVEDIPLLAKEVYVGPAMAEEFNVLQEILTGFDVLIFGGAKLDKIELLEDLIAAINPNGFALIGSGPSPMINNGKDGLLEKLRRGDPGRVIPAMDYKDETTYDIGPQTLDKFLKKLDGLSGQETIILNGTMGYMEHESGKYKEGTQKVIEKLIELANRGVRIIIIGGDASDTANKYGLAKQKNAILFTGGGVPLKILAGEALSGLEALYNKQQELRKAEPKTPVSPTKEAQEERQVQSIAPEPYPAANTDWLIKTEGLNHDIAEKWSAFAQALYGFENMIRKELAVKYSDLSAIVKPRQKTGESLLLYADDILENATIMDLDKTFKDILKESSILNGGKIVIYAKKKANGEILEKLIKRADSSTDTVIITEDELKSTKNCVSTDANELKCLVEKAAACSINTKNILGVIRGPSQTPEDLAKIAKDLKLPIIIVGLEKNSLYSFAEALAAAILAKDSGGKNGWVIPLPAIQAITKDMMAEYERYRSSLQALVAA